MNTAEENNPAALASKFINHTQKHIFLTGKAGTGKTTFLKHIIQHTHKKAVIVAPTGIAAINAGGVTIHSLFQLPFGTFIPVNQHSVAHQSHLKLTTPSSLMSNLQMNHNKRKLLKELELLIIDEVSMLRADLLDAMDTMLRSLKRQNNKSFGGVQVLFIGDLLQLPPVVKEDEWAILREYYNSIYFFEAKALQHEKPLYIELEKIYRQADNRFISLLNNLRNNNVDEYDFELLNEYYKPDFKAGKDENYITLTTHNYKADKLNKEYLNEIQATSFYYQASISGDFNEYAYPVEKNLELKQGSQIMFVKNDPTGAQRFFNGKIGVVSSISYQEIKVKFNDSDTLLTLETYEWKNIKYELNEITNEIEEKVVGTFTQYPVKLAWAITVHKSQGLTFDYAIIDIGNAFAPGQVYVALSRLRSLDGLVLTSRINYQSMRQDELVMEFSKTKSQSDDLLEIIDIEQAIYVKEYLSKCFDLSALSKALYYHIESYSKDENRSAKQQHKSWAGELKSKLDAVKPHADKFLIQITGILEKGENGYLELTDARVKAATHYFAPVFKAISTSIFNHIETIKKEKQIKTYLTELFDLETACNEQFKRMQKAGMFTTALISRKEFTGESMQKELCDELRLEQISGALSALKTKKQGRIKAGIEGEGSPKKEKSDTKETSFGLFEKGHSIAEIAKLRNYAITTIEGHLAQYVAKGKLKSIQFVSDEKKELVVAAAKKLDTFNLGPIKNELGDEYSYSDIRFALAGYLSENVDYVKE